METVEGNKMSTETLVGVSCSAQPTDDDSHKIVKPRSEEKAVDDLGSENEVLEGGGDGGAAVGITKTIVEETEGSVVKMVQEGSEEMEGAVLNNQERDEKMEGNEIQENEKKGGFGNLVGDGDEDMKVKCSGNGISLVVDVKGSLAGENGSKVKPVSEGDTGSLADEHDENAGWAPMEVCSSEEKVKKQHDGEESSASEEDLSQNDDGNAGEEPPLVGMQENGRDSGSKLAEFEMEYDGEEDESEEDHDFVTGDFVWGKIKSHPWWPGQIYDPLDASDYAAKFNRKSRLLVAYFGDGSFSWCSPSQLKPFVDHFEEMSKQSGSKNFVNAVQKALDEIGRLVEAEFMCKCQTVDRVENPTAVNSGIKAGVLVPKGNTIKVLIARMEPAELLSTLKASATMESGTRMPELELTVLRSCLSAFYSRKGGYLLPVYDEPKCIEGLEDKMRTGTVANSDINGPSECAENTDDKLYQGRKQKSVAELLGEGTSVKTSKDGGSSTKSLSGMKRERKRMVVLVAESPKSDHESGGVEEETMSPRQRKKSKYLSPPYTSPIWSGTLKSIKELKTEPEKVPETAVKQVEDSFRKKSPRGRRPREESGSLDSKDEHKKTTVNVSKALNGLIHAALDPSEKKNLTATTEFISSFRSSVFRDGSDDQPDGKKDSPVTLVIEFPPAASLPTKPVLLRRYSKIGGLMKKETQILHDCSCAVVRFASSSDAEAALVMSLEEKPFGDVRYALDDIYVTSDEGAGAGRKAVDMAFVKQKLELVMEMVRNCGEGEMSAGMKASLEGRMKELVEKVTEMG